MSNLPDYMNFQRTSSRIRRATISEKRILSFHRSRPIRFNGKDCTLPHDVTESGLVRIYFYWPARSAWHYIHVPFRIYTRTLTYRFAPIDN